MGTVAGFAACLNTLKHWPHLMSCFSEFLILVFFFLFSFTVI